MSHTDFLQEIRELMRDKLRTAGFCNTNVERLTTIFVDGIGGYGAVIQGESGYNPNAVLLRGDYRADGKKSLNVQVHGVYSRWAKMAILKETPHGETK